MTVLRTVTPDPGPFRRIEPGSHGPGPYGTVLWTVPPDPGFEVPLLGRHQARNAALAAVAAAVAPWRGAPVTTGHIRAGLARTTIRARLETIARRPLVIVDGAHNPAGAAALAASLEELGVRGMPLVFGAMRGKRVTAVLRTLARLDPRPVFTAVDDPKAIPPGELLVTWRRIGAGGDAATAHAAGRVTPDPGEALRLAAELRSAGQPVVVAGSLYLVGAVRALLTGEREET